MNDRSDTRKAPHVVAHCFTIRNDSYFLKYTPYRNRAGTSFRENAGVRKVSKDFSY